VVVEAAKCPFNELGWGVIGAWVALLAAVVVAGVF
jgi:hypothetical protein